ncbi:MAG: thioredoxin domain-containing protein [Pseudomonadota bacterium]|nr:thioredoxin domain-containing protein [Pseudomonadota bacterium]
MTNQFNQNRLAEATSPYLRQHMHNPVHWQPWEQAVFDEARRRNVPVLLSVGYAACHWCHVMAHESFEDAEVAALMNAHYVCIKLDREERPDLDDIYMTALSMMGEQGGWPLTMFLDPDGVPFWGGTYFPKTPQYGRPGFMQILQEQARVYAEAPEKIARNCKALGDGLRARAAEEAHGKLPPDLTARAARSLTAHIDMNQGGLGAAPKFPQPFLYRFLWQQAQLGDNNALRDSVLVTANNICQGGLYDHLGGGFARYSVDTAWLVPHFEKMLYDNAQLVDLLTRLWRTTKNPIYAARIAATIDWLVNEMQLPDGGFAASLDADSEGAEGLFYIWTPEEIENVLGDKTAIFSEAYGVTAEGNFENRNILNRLHAVDAKNTHEVEAGLAEARIALLARRNTRPRPERDDKMLADWNAMTITALAHAAQTFRNADWRALAIRAFAALERDLCETVNGQATGRLVHSARRVEKTVHRLDLCLAADLVHAAEAAIALYQGTGEAAYLHKAIGWMGSLESAYADTRRGGYFENDDRTPGLLVRNRNVQDNAMPATNAVALRVFAALAQLTGDMGFARRADAIRDALAGMMAKNYPSMTGLLDAATASRHPATLVIRTVPDDGETLALVQAATQHPIVDLLIVELPPGADLPPDHPAHAKEIINGRTTAYLCPGQECLPPVHEAEKLVSYLDDLMSRRQKGHVPSG